MFFLAWIEFPAPGNVQAKDKMIPGVSAAGFEVGPDEQGSQPIPFGFLKTKIG